MRSGISACLLCLGLLLGSTAHAAKVSGITVPDTLDVSGTELVLNGAGLRKKLIIKIYVSGLYLQAPSQDAAAIVAADETMAVTIHVRSDLMTRKRLVAALKDGFKASTGGDTAPIQAEIDQLIGMMQDNVRPGDVYSLTYEPEVGTSVQRGDEQKGVIEGLPFKQALFGIWLSDNPVQKSLKKAMLGG